MGSECVWLVGGRGGPRNAGLVERAWAEDGQGGGQGVEDEYMGVVFFFFQAEDGIRDYKVTGVQTCALPISTLNAFGAGPDAGNVVEIRSWTSRITEQRKRGIAIPKLYPSFWRAAWLARCAKIGRASCRERV